MRRRYFEAIQRDTKSKRTSEWMNMCVRDELRKREKERQSPRIITNQTIVFTRINFNLQLNSSPQLKVKKRKQTWMILYETKTEGTQDDRFRRALLNERPVIDWFCFSPFPNPWFFFKVFSRKSSQRKSIGPIGLSNVHIAILVRLHLVT